MKNQQTKIRPVKLILKSVKSESVFAIDSAGLWAGSGSTSLSTAQTLVPIQCNMAAPYWDIGSFTFLQWKWMKVRCPSFFTVYGSDTL